MTLNYTKDLNRVSSRCPMYPTPPNMSTHDKHNEFAIDLFCKMQHNYINKKSWARKLCHVSVNLQNKKSSFVFSITNVKIYHKLLVYRIVLHFTSLTFFAAKQFYFITYLYFGFGRLPIFSKVVSESELEELLVCCFFGRRTLVLMGFLFLDKVCRPLGLSGIEFDSYC